ncbi:MAG TPA: hypothetical protein EYN67_09845 [Flavobacteriales bacterium]|nr:hypothetical protein [Methylococcaceae bacterium]HHZ95836.1 hypothetical protein [Flavobacteriales bacterium]
MIYTAYGKGCKLTLNFIFAGQYGLRAEYKNADGDYTYIAEPTIIDSGLITKELTDAAYQVALDEINIATKALLGEVPTEPDSGIDRIQWLVDNKTIVVDNDLKIG